MEKISSRKNAAVTHMRALVNDAGYRRERGEFVCDGAKLLREAVDAGIELSSVLSVSAPLAELPEGTPAYLVPRELLAYVSPLKNSPGPVFSAKRPALPAPEKGRFLILDGVQDPGNVGTVIRTAEAFGAAAVILTNACADPFGPKAARAAMGSVFRLPVLELEFSGLLDFLKKRELRLYGAALSADAADIRRLDLTNAAVAVGSEGRGLSRALLDLCAEKLVIPMAGGAESLNAAVAASILLWEMSRRA